MKRYNGVRVPHGCIVWVSEDGARRELNPRLDLRRHSPTGFDWGYAGSGPSQLALAILADHLHDDERALQLYQDFKWKVVTGFDRGAWTLTAREIDAVLAQLPVPDDP